MRPSRRIPLLRGFVGATVATFVALASHVWVGGGMPGSLGVAVPWLLSLTVCTLVAGRELSVLRLSASVLASQLMFHALFVLGSVTPGGGFAPHVHGAAPLVLGGEAPVLVPEDVGMWGAHAVAAVITIAALHRGEQIVQALLAIASAVAGWLRRIVRIPASARCVAAARIPWTVLAAPRLRGLHLGAMRRRGPPLRLS